MTSCIDCELTPAAGGNWGRRCQECYRTYKRHKMRQVYRERRNAALILLGGQCVDCGSEENLEFDHIDAADKSYHINSLFSGGRRDKLMTELAKCVLRCNDCHKIKSSREGDYSFRR
jgi:5-methylcytosine-specific restriction endonuclease McrA